ncbi:ferredoxin [Rhizobium sp. Root274]|uniref:4Fe-4S dicluster domain-containing protein n=1 Tax=unclassified Rhizobium TaxID=2613769 RepID=UPI0007150A08|nr:MULTISPECIES: 4Fe-4S dicluster domain-containing protein [unclassified Rhizobium]KQW26983.1 ferredoxin [Rhizobium sp. Root1240]KRD27955.1 ferredoxin [Rhizobium sp. Root274]
MSGPSAVLDRLDGLLAAQGLLRRGVVLFDDGDAAPAFADGRRAAAVVLVGVTGQAMWPVFSAWREAAPDRGGSDPLDRWSEVVLDDIAAQFRALALYPSRAPYQPFQSWAMRAEGLKASPLGVLIHPVLGLWHSYRGALAFAEWDDGRADEGDGRLAGPHPCDACSEQPCLSACPASAVSLDRFDVTGCRSYLASDLGQASCMTGGCRARDACPVGVAYRYPQAQVSFHLQALRLPSS